MNINPEIINQAKNLMGNADQVNQILSMLNGGKVNPEQMVRTICKQRGINVEEFMKEISK